MKKRIVCVLLALLISSTQILTVSASREDDLRNEQAYTNEQLNNAYATIDSLQQQKEALAAQISEKEQNLVDVMVNINVLETDISAKEEAITKTNADLKKAETARDKQYDAMKMRIQYLYENGGNDAWFQMMLNAENLSDLLTKAEYTQKMYEYDRQSLDKYEQTVEDVTNLGIQLESEKAELVDMKGSYEQQQVNLQTEIDQKKAESDNYSAEIQNAQAQANEYAALLQQQTAEIQRLEAERIAAEEEARRQAEAAAAAEEAARQEAEAQENANADEEYTEEGSEESSDDQNYEDNTDESYDDGSSEDESYDEANGDSSEDGSYDDGSSDESYTDDSDDGVEEGNGEVSDSEDTDSSDDGSSGSVSSGSGQAVADFALQFVGNPYVWGGTSLTNGADCSGFVQSVYANFGVSLPRVTWDQMNAGVEVSYSQAQPGDLICYGDHIGIYIGGGQIVHASNSAPYPAGGIKTSTATYRTILSVRRVI